MMSMHVSVAHNDSHIARYSSVGGDVVIPIIIGETMRP